MNYINQMTMLDYYQILGVSKEATPEQIKSAYRRYAKIFHPDISLRKDAKIKFQLINEAYHILSNPRSRRIYDFRIHRMAEAYKKFGTSRRNVEYESYYKEYTNAWYAQNRRKATARNEKFIKERMVDQILFYSMLLIGGAAFIFGLFDLLYKPRKGLDNFSGVLFGISFLVILLYGWRLKTKEI